jgi:hypothetical protein
MEGIVIWHWVLVMAGMVVGYHILAFLVLAFLHKEKR